MGKGERIFIQAVAHGQRRDVMRATASRLKDEAATLDMMAEQESDGYFEAVNTLAVVWMQENPSGFSSLDVARAEVRRSVEMELRTRMSRPKP